MSKLEDLIPGEAQKLSDVLNGRVQEQPTEQTPQDTPPVETKTEPTPQQIDWLTEFNKTVGREGESAFKNAESVKTFFDEMNGRVGEYEQKLNESKGWEDKYNALEQMVKEHEGKYDQLNTVFKGDKDAMKRFYIAEGMKAQNVNPNIVNKVIDPSLKDKSSVELAVLGRQINSPRLSGKEAAIKEMLLREVGFNVEEAREEGKSVDQMFDSLSASQMAEFDAEADEVLSNVNKLISSIEIPETADPIRNILEGRKTQLETAEALKATWSGKEATQKIIPKLENIKLSHEGFEFPYKMSEAEMVPYLQEIAIKAALQGKEFNEENLTNLVDRAHRSFIGDNYAKILSAALKQAEVKSKEQIEKDVYNGKQSGIQKENNSNENPQSWADIWEQRAKKKDVRNR